MAESQIFADLEPIFWLLGLFLSSLLERSYDLPILLSNVVGFIRIGGDIIEFHYLSQRRSPYQLPLITTCHFLRSGFRKYKEWLAR